VLRSPAMPVDQQDHFEEPELTRPEPAYSEAA
jgi:hypothetical protein